MNSFEDQNFSLGEDDEGVLQNDLNTSDTATTQSPLATDADQLYASQAIAKSASVGCMLRCLPDHNSGRGSKIQTVSRSPSRSTLGQIRIGSPASAGKATNITRHPWPLFTRGLRESDSFSEASEETPEESSFWGVEEMVSIYTLPQSGQSGGNGPRCTPTRNPRKNAPFGGVSVSLSTTPTDSPSRLHANEGKKIRPSLRHCIGGQGTGSVDTSPVLRNVISRRTAGSAHVSCERASANVSSKLARPTLSCVPTILQATTSGPMSSSICLISPNANPNSRGISQPALSTSVQKASRCSASRSYSPEVRKASPSPNPLLSGAVVPPLEIRQWPAVGPPGLGHSMSEKSTIKMPTIEQHPEEDGDQLQSLCCAPPFPERLNSGHNTRVTHSRHRRSAEELMVVTPREPPKMSPCRRVEMKAPPPFEGTRKVGKVDNVRRTSTDSSSTVSPGGVCRASPRSKVASGETLSEVMLAA